MIKKLKNFFKDEEGASMVEYGLLVALIADCMHPRHYLCRH